MALAGAVSGPFFGMGWVVTLLAQLPAALYLLLLPLGWRATPPALLAVGGLLVVLLLGRPQWHSPLPSDFTVLSWNMGVDVPHLKLAAEDLRNLDWDVALLQEAGLTISHDVGKELLELMPVAYAVRGGYEGELLILSRRYPLRNPQQFLVANLRSELEVEVDLGGANLRLVDVHLVRSDWNRPTDFLESAKLRETQVRDLLTRFGDDRTLIGGDFNLPAPSDPIDRMRERFQDSFETAGTGFGMTYPRPVPLWRIDFLFASRDLTVSDCRTLSLRASDHKALLTRLKLLPPRGNPHSPPPGPPPVQE